MEFVRGRWRGRWKRRRMASTGRVFSLLCVCFCFLCFSVLALISTDARNAAVASETGNSRSTGGTGSPVQQQGWPAPESKGGEGGATAALEGAARRRRSMVAGTRRYLVGPGSYPPRCASKCGACNPCKPVHVPVPPGTPVITEYYPEAWRCKCGGKLYMP